MRDTIRILSSEEELHAERSLAAALKLGVRAGRPIVRCRWCGESYRIGAGHRGSLYCLRRVRERDLRLRGLERVSACYVPWLDEAGVPWEIHLTDPVTYYGKNPSFRAVSALDPHSWCPKDAAKVAPNSRLTKEERIRALRALAAECTEEWSRADAGKRGLLGRVQARAVAAVQKMTLVPGKNSLPLGLEATYAPPEEDRVFGGKHVVMVLHDGRDMGVHAADTREACEGFVIGFIHGLTGAAHVNAR